MEASGENIFRARRQDQNHAADLDSPRYHARLDHDHQRERGYEVIEERFTRDELYIAGKSLPAPRLN